MFTSENVQKFEFSDVNIKPKNEIIGTSLCQMYKLYVCPFAYQTFYNIYFSSRKNIRDIDFTISQLSLTFYLKFKDY